MSSVKSPQDFDHDGLLDGEHGDAVVAVIKSWMQNMAVFGKPDGCVVMRGVLPPHVIEGILRDTTATCPGLSSGSE